MFWLRESRSLFRRWLPLLWDPKKLLPPAARPDPLEEAVAAGIAAGHARRRMTAQTRERAVRIRDRARASKDHASAISELLLLVRENPCVEELQKIVARLLHEMHDDERALDAWSGINRRFPRAMDAFRTLITLTHRRLGSEAAHRLVQSRFPKMPADFDQLLAYAEACELIGAAVEKRAAFERLARLFEKGSRSRLGATAWLGGRGSERLAGPPLARPANRQALHMDGLFDDLAAAVPGERDSPPFSSVRVLGALFEQVLASRSTVVKRERRRRGPVVFLCGSLGSGGAERQLVTTAIGLNELAPEGTSDGDLVLRPVSVLARSLKDRSDGEFFLGDLERAGIPVRCYRELPDFHGDLEGSAVRPVLAALRFLPQAIAEAVTKTTDFLRALDPEVVHIWQDGLIYATSFAALLAGVPRIILSSRSVPQADRRSRYPVEYDIIYRSMTRAPGVKLSVNSRHAADRYAAWLGLDRDEIAVIPNGVSRAPATADREAEALFAGFAVRTGGVSLTLGTVMRMDANKRPLLWIDVAARLLREMPAARFILVGDGPLRKAAAQRAAAHSVLDRFLFVGRSACVWYWLSKMDAFMLLSEHEGLPNALIEAQLAGVPVIASPAGGAAETLVAGETGILTSQSPGAEEVAAAVANLAGAPGRLKEMSIAAERWAREAFPVSRMIARTIDLYRAAGETA